MHTLRSQGSRRLGAAVIAAAVFAALVTANATIGAGSASAAQNGGKNGPVNPAHPAPAPALPVPAHGTYTPMVPLAGSVPRTVIYTITVTNTGQLPYTAATPASFTDDLTKVLDDATYNADAKATSGTTAYSTANVLSWSGPLALGQVVTVTYSVLVDDPDNGDLQLVNAVVTPAGGSCIAGSTLAACKTTVSDVVPVAATPPSGGLAFTGVPAGAQFGFALLAFVLGFGLLLLARRRRESARRS